MMLEIVDDDAFKIKTGFLLGEVNGDFAAKFVWACTFLFFYSLTGEIFFFKVVKINLTNLLRKNLPQLLDQSKRKLSPLSANKFPSDQMEDG